MVPPEERAKLYVQARGQWKLKEPRRALPVPTSSLFAFDFRVFIDE